MSDYPATKVKDVSIEPFGDTKVRIMMEMIVGVNRLAEVGSEMLHGAIEHMKSEAKTRKKDPNPSCRTLRIALSKPACPSDWP